MQNEIKNIIFDWGNVIIDVSMNNFTEACQMAGIKFTDEEVNSTHKAGFFLAFEIGEISEDEFRNEIRKRATTSLTDIEIDTIWNKILGQTPKEKLELLYSLSNQYDLYLLSNTNAIHWNAFSKNSFICNGTNMINSFKGIYLSYQLHCAKPSSEIFRKTIEIAKINACETLFIDDSSKNCETAQALGMRVHNYIPGSDLKNSILGEIEK